jgi:hypothetical protein
MWTPPEDPASGVTTSADRCIALLGVSPSHCENDVIEVVVQFEVIAVIPATVSHRLDPHAGSTVPPALPSTVEFRHVVEAKLASWAPAFHFERKR